MATELLDPPTTTDTLRQHAEGLAQNVEERLEAPPERDEAEPDDERIARRQRFFEDIRSSLLPIARSPAWRAHDLARELLLLLEELRDAIAADPGAQDANWRQREILQRMLVVLRGMIRQLEHDDLDRPERAAQYVAELLRDVEVSELAELLETSPRMVAKYRGGDVGQIRKNPYRVTLIAQLVNELQYSMTPRGMLLWFNAPMDALDGKTPRELLDADPKANRPRLIAFARGGRAQLDLGGDADGDMDQAA